MCRAAFPLVFMTDACESRKSDSSRTEQYPNEETCFPEDSMHKKTNSICLLIAVSFATAARGTTIAVFESIPDALSANDMSPDGRYIVGQTDFDQDFLPDGTYLYDTHTGVMTILPPEATDAA